jgi:hypothetical protein
VGFDCGLAKPADAPWLHGAGATCYAVSYSTGAGTYGTDCSAGSADPTSGKACSMGASPCATGFSCLSTIECDPQAYCTKECAADTDCPPTMFCGTPSGLGCMADSDCGPGYSCKDIPGGTGKRCQQPQKCMKRGYCSNCATDDECPNGTVCAQLPSGERYCANTCTDTKTSLDCPQPIYDDLGNQFSGVYATCKPARPGSKVNVCAPVKGLCHGESALARLAGKLDTFCSPCRPGVASDCGDGICYTNPYDRETFCTSGCTITYVIHPDYTVSASGDTCPDLMNTACQPSFGPDGCHKINEPCTKAGICIERAIGVESCFPPPPMSM